MKKISLSLFPLVLNLRVAAGSVVVAGCLCMVAATFLWLTRSEGQNAKLPTAVMSIVTAPTPTPTSDSILVPLATVSGDAIPSPPAGQEIVKGAFVQITGTGGAGLRLRSEPGVAAPVLLLGSEAEVFRVEDGPVEMDGYLWWYLVGPFDPGRFGWAVSNYLVVIQNP